MRELQHVDCSPRLPAARTSCRSIRPYSLVLPESGQAAAVSCFLISFSVSAIEDRRGELHAQSLRGPAEMGFENLNRRSYDSDAERIENDFNRRAIGKIRHIFLRQKCARSHPYYRDGRHLIADGKLALHRE